MKKSWILALMLAVASTGCTTVALEQYTLNQIHSSGNCRDKAVLDCLAAVAANPDTLPSFSLFGNGTTYVQDQANLSSTTTWLRSVGSFGLETLGVTVSRSPHGDWTVASIVEYQQLEAMHCACLWALCGPDRAKRENPEILRDPRIDPIPGEPHFGVEERLTRIPSGWVHCGRLKDVPLCARYKANSGDTWVWVMPDATEAFAQFTLVLHDIATRDTSSLTVPQHVVVLTKDDVTPIKDLTDSTKQVSISTAETRAVADPKHRAEIENAMREAIQKSGKVNLTWAEWMAYTVPYHGAPLTINPGSTVSRPTPMQATLAMPGTPASTNPPGSPPAGIKWDLKQPE